MPIFLNPLVIYRLLFLILSVLADSVHHQEALTVETRKNTFLFSENSDLPRGAFLVTNLSGAADLADFLDRNPDIQVTHLLLSDSSTHELQTRWHEVPELDDSAILDHPAVLHRIMVRVSPTLEVFSYLLYHRKWALTLHPESLPSEDTADRLFDHEFPRLRELTLREVDIWKGVECGDDSDFDEDPLPQCVFPSLPSLSHLHIVSNWALDYKLPSLTTFKESLPKLSHIRLTGTRVPEEMRPWKPLYESERNSTLSDLRLLYTPGYYPLLDVHPDFWCGTPGVEYDDLMEKLGEQSDLGESGRLLWPSEEDFRRYGKDYGTYPVDHAIKDFRTRLFGEGDGEWFTTEERPWAESMTEWWWHRCLSERND